MALGVLVVFKKWNESDIEFAVNPGNVLSVSRTRREGCVEIVFGGGWTISVQGTFEDVADEIDKALVG